MDGVEVAVEEDARAVAVALEHAEHERHLAPLDRVGLDAHPDLTHLLDHPVVGAGVLADDAADADDLLQQLLGALDADAGGAGLLLGGH